MELVWKWGGMETGMETEGIASTMVHQYKVWNRGVVPYQKQNGLAPSVQRYGTLL